MGEHSNVASVEVFEGEDEQWYWRAKAANHEIVATSEAYAKKFNVLRAVDATFPSTIPIHVIDK